MNFGLSLRTEFARFTRTLVLKSFPISRKLLFTPTSSMHNDSRFLSWVADPWTWVSNFSMMSVQLSNFEVVSLIGLKTYLFTPGFYIILWFPLLFLLSRDMHIMFLLPSTDFSCASIMNALDWNLLSRDEFVLKSCSLEFVKTFVTRFVLSGVLPCPMIPMTSGSMDPTLIGKILIPLTMWVIIE